MTKEGGKFSLEGSNSELGNEDFFVTAKTRCGAEKIGVMKENPVSRDIFPISVVFKS